MLVHTASKEIVTQYFDNNLNGTTEKKNSKLHPLHVQWVGALSYSCCMYNATSNILKALSRSSTVMTFLAFCSEL